MTPALSCEKGPTKQFFEEQRYMMKLKWRWIPHYLMAGMRQRLKRSDCSPFSHDLSLSDFVLFEYLKRNDLYDRGKSFRNSEM